MSDLSFIEREKRKLGFTEEYVVKITAVSSFDDFARGRHNEINQLFRVSKRRNTVDERPRKSEEAARVQERRKTVTFGSVVVIPNKERAEQLNSFMNVPRNSTLFNRSSRINRKRDTFQLNVGENIGRANNLNDNSSAGESQSNNSCTNGTGFRDLSREHIDSVLNSYRCAVNNMAFSDQNQLNESNGNEENEMNAPNSTAKRPLPRLMPLIKLNQQKPPQSFITNNRN